MDNKMTAVVGGKCEVTFKLDSTLSKVIDREFRSRLLRSKQGLGRFTLRLARGFEDQTQYVFIWESNTPNHNTILSPVCPTFRKELHSRNITNYLIIYTHVHSALSPLSAVVASHIIDLLLLLCYLL